MDAMHISPAIRQLLDDQTIKLAAAQVPATIQGTLHAALQHAIAAAFVDSFRLAVNLKPS